MELPAPGRGSLIWDSSLPLLVAFLYLNVSAVLVRQFDVPSMLRVAVVIFTVMAILERRLKGIPDVLLQPLPVLLAGYVSIQLLTTTFAQSPRLADERLFDSLKALGLLLLMVALATNWHRIRDSCYALIGSAAFLALLGIYQAATGSYQRWFGGFARVKEAHIYGEVFQTRIAGPVGDPNFFAQILLIAVPVGLFLGWESSGRLRRWIAFGCAGLAITAILLTYSRGGMLALSVVLGLTLIVHRVQRGRMFAGAAVLLLILMLLPASFTRRFVTLEEILPGSEETLHPDSSFQKRKLLTAAAWETFKDNPLLGVGAGNFTVWFNHYAEQVGSDAREYDDPGEKHYPHNLYLEIAAETGLAGLLSFAVVVAVTLASYRSSYRQLLKAGNREMAGVAKALELALIGYLVSSLFLHGHFQRYLWLLFAFGAALSRLTAPRAAAAPDAAAEEAL